MGGIVTPSYKTGFYSPRRGGVPKYPSLWRGCVGAWSPALGPTGSRVIDQSVYGNHGTLTNMDPANDWVVSGGVGSLDLDGTNDSVATTFGIQSASTLSISCWIYHRAISHNYAGVIFSRTQVTATGISLVEGTRYGYHWGDYYWYWTGGPLVTLNRWEHIVLVVRPNSGVYYKDGVAYTNSHTHASQSNTNFVIGADLGGNRFINGFIADIRVYNRELPQAEVELLALRRSIAYEAQTKRNFFFVPASGITSNLSATLSLSTLSSAGTVANGASGELAATLGDATLTSTGILSAGASGSTSVTLSDAALSAAGTVAAGASGNTSATLDAATLVSAGTLTAGLSAAVARTLDSVTLVSTGSESSTPTGSVSSTLGTLTASSSGTVAAGPTGILSASLTACTLSATGTVATGLTATVTSTLGSLSLASGGSLSAVLTAQVNQALESCVVSSSGTVANGTTGALSVTLASVTLVAGDTVVSSSGFRIKINGAWEDTTVYVKDGTWKVATPFIKVSGVWE